MKIKSFSFTGVDCFSYPAMAGVYNPDDDEEEVKIHTKLIPVLEH